MKINRLQLMSEKLNLNSVANKIMSKGLGGLNEITIFKTVFDFDKLRNHLFKKENKRDIYDKIKWNDNNLWNAYVVSGWMGNEDNVKQFIDNFYKFMKDQYK